MSSFDELEEKYNKFIKSLDSNLVKDKNEIHKSIEEMEDIAIEILCALKTLKRDN